MITIIVVVRVQRFRAKGGPGGRDLIAAVKRIRIRISSKLENGPKLYRGMCAGV